MVDTRDSKSRAKERGGSSPLQGIILRSLIELEEVRQQITRFWWFSRSNEWRISILKSSALHPPEYMLQHLWVVNIWIGQITPWISLFASEQLELGSVNSNVYYWYRGSFNWEDPRYRFETKRKKLFYLVIQLNQRFVIGTDRNNHLVREKPSFSQQCLCHLIQ